MVTSASKKQLLPPAKLDHTQPIFAGGKPTNSGHAANGPCTAASISRLRGAVVSIDPSQSLAASLVLPNTKSRRNRKLNTNHKHLGHDLGHDGEQNNACQLQLHRRRYHPGDNDEP